MEYLLFNDWYGWGVLLFTVATVLWMILRNRSSHRTSRQSTKVATARLRPNPTSSNAPSKRKIRITRRESAWHKKTEIPEFNKIVDASNCRIFDVRSLWTDTIIAEIYLKEDFCKSLQEYLLSFDPESSGRIHQVSTEVGGFLLGKYAREHDTSAYRVVVETFVPIASEDEHQLRLEFDTHSLSVTLGSAQDQHPDQILVGWFHTHPGHGLFLSNLDLAIQRGFFNEDFQFAMEIDSLSPRLDLGFFTHKRNGEINYLKEDENWFSWRNIERELL